VCAVLVLRPGALGDTLLAVPALRALNRSFTPLTLAALGSAARCLAALGEIDRGLAFDDPSLSWLFTRDVRPVEPVVAWMSSGVPHATLLAPSRPPRMDRHCARYLLETLSPLHIDLSWDDSPLRVTPAPSDEVLVHPGSGSPAKNWPAKHFAHLIGSLDGAVRLIVGEADLAAATAVETSLGHSLPRLSQPSLAELAARLAGCRGYVGNDSGVSHLAGLCGARTIALFGPTDPKVWSPIGPDVRILPFTADPEVIAAMLTRG
jgi:ADP-heptose:LPS heptosyltransferase